MNKTSKESQHYCSKHHPKTGPDPPYLRLLVAVLLGGSLVVALLSRANYTSPLFSCVGSNAAATKTLEAIVHYATTRAIPQQTLAEITVTFDVLKSKAPCDFLVFGLGRDSIMWASLNPGGSTLFLEEEPNWIANILGDAPGLRADAVAYRTQVSEADPLLGHYRDEPACWANNSFLHGNNKCRLALNTLSDKVYETEWDVIMIDAPRGYFKEAPGRMAAIYSSAVIARHRRKPGATHVFLHDVDRRVEKKYAETFLCEKNLVKGVGKLWHFEIPSTTNGTIGFC